MQPDLIDETDPGDQLRTASAVEQASQKLLAPTWHTLLIIAFVAAASIAGAKGPKHPSVGDATGRYGHLPTYFASMALEWILAALTLFGLRLRKTPLHSVLGDNKPGIKEWFVDAGVAGVFWIVALTVLGVLATMLKPMHLHPESIRGTVSKLAPSSPIELLAWAVLCVSAGICEEFVFRGYLQLQFSRLSHRVWIGVLASSVLFGLSHGYEGISGMLLIIAFGALFSVLRLLRNNTRAGMLAHAWHDLFSGMVLYALAHHSLLS